MSTISHHASRGILWCRRLGGNWFGALLNVRYSTVRYGTLQISFVPTALARETEVTLIFPGQGATSPFGRYLWRLISSARPTPRFTSSPTLQSHHHPCLFFFFPFTISSLVLIFFCKMGRGFDWLGPPGIPWLGDTPIWIDTPISKTLASLGILLARLRLDLAFSWVWFSSLFSRFSRASSLRYESGCARWLR